MQKRKKIPALLLTLLLMLVLAPAAYADTDANTPQITQQPDQLVLQLGARWAGVEFELRTDAGVFPVPVLRNKRKRLITARDKRQPRDLVRDPSVH